MTANVNILNQGIFISGDWLEEATDPIIDSFLDYKNTDYGLVFAGSAKIASTGIQNAFLLPAAKMIVDGSLASASHPEVECQIAHEVNDRSMVAAHLAKAVTKRALARSCFTEAYFNSDLMLHGDNDDIKNLTDQECLQSLASAAFSDSAFVIGGAVRKIQVEIPETTKYSAIIKSSLGLLVLSKIANGVLPMAHMRLGERYVYSKNLVLVNSPSGPIVRINPAMVALLKNDYSDSEGCPAARLKSGYEKGSMIQADWRRMVDYLAPDAATVNLYREPAKVKALSPLVQ